MDIKRGDVFLANLGSGSGSEQGGDRPVVVIQNNTGNHFSPTIIVAAITSKRFNRNLPTHVTLSQDQYSTPYSCTILTEQVRTIDKNRLMGNKLFSLNDMDAVRLNKALMISMGLVEQPQKQNKQNIIEFNRAAM